MFYNFFEKTLQAHITSPKRLSTSLYKVQLKESLIYARDVRPIFIDESKTLPHSWEETVTQISNFTSQRYKVL